MLILQPPAATYQNLSNYFQKYSRDLTGWGYIKFMTKNKRLDITPEWYDNENVRPKLFNVTMARGTDGSYRIVEAVVEAVVNQYESRIQRVDARDLSRDLNRGRVFAL